ncbi:YaiI/YqxD family protein [Shimia sp. MIT1388]|uniref:YaiI/YqxD family protein n=2 Tax=Shimia TaxID=573139 RepID=UPI00399B5888
MTAIYVDADACPVKAEVERVGTRHKVKIYVVSNGGLRPSQNPLVENVIVPEGPDVADMWIADRAKTGDVVITGDIPLAAKCVESGARVLKHNGEALTAANIGNVLATRDLMADLRAADPFRQGGGKGFTKADRSRFLDALERELRAAKREVECCWQP